MEPNGNVLRLALPKGRMQGGVLTLLEDAGLPVRGGERDYRASMPLAGVEAKFLKPQNIVEMLHAGSRDVGFTGADWVSELDGELIELLDTGLDRVKVVAAAPHALAPDGRLPRQPLVVASEYRNLTERWIARAQLDATFVRSYGATEVFPPEDADVIVDNTATGSTLRANDLAIVDLVMESSTRLYANPAALEVPTKRERIDQLVLLVRSVVEARRRVMLEVNVGEEQLAGVIAALPAMRQPTVSPLHGQSGYAVKAAVPRADLAELIPRIKRSGGSDVVVTQLDQIVP